MEKFIIIAHRGGKGPFKENTLKAFQYSIEHGADAVEMDMRYDHYRQRFYLEHDFLHSPFDRPNTISRIIPFLPATAQLVIELKTNYLIRKKYAREFLEVVKEYKLLKRAIIISYNPFVLYQLRKANKDLQIGYICPSWTRWWFFTKWVLANVKPQMVFLHKRILLNQPVLNYLRKKGLKIFAYTLNKPEEWHSLGNFKLDGMVTDYPEEAKNGIKKMK